MFSNNFSNIIFSYRIKNGKNKTYELYVIYNKIIRQNIFYYMLLSINQHTFTTPEQILEFFFSLKHT